ncbi:MAG: 2-keto-4-pentenoate hydratase [Candidatus Dormibacteria bacterium]
MRDVGEAASALLSAEDRVQSVAPLTASWASLDVETAYQVQDETLRRRLERGERLIGVKLGLTSLAKQRQMGVASVITGWLTDAMAHRAEQPIAAARLIHPRAEPEVVLEVGRTLKGPGITGAQALAAVCAVRAGIEVIDSRYRDFKFTLPDVVADNASSARFVLGHTALAIRDLDLWLEACVLEVGGRVVDSATAAAVQGHPAEALACGANELGRRGIALEEGWLVLTGGMTEAVELAPGVPVTATFTSLGSVSALRGR